MFGVGGGTVGRSEVVARAVLDAVVGRVGGGTLILRVWTAAAGGAWGGFGGDARGEVFLRRDGRRGFDEDAYSAV